MACALSVPSLVGQSMPKYGNPRITFAVGTTAAYSSMAVCSLNAVLVRGEVAEGPDCKFSWYAITKKALTAGARALML